MEMADTSQAPSEVNEAVPGGSGRKSPQDNERKRKHSESLPSPEKEEGEWTSSEEEEELQLMNGSLEYDLDQMRLKEEFEVTDIYSDASGFTMEYLKENGLEEPIVFRNSEASLGLKTPENGTLTASYILKAVGDRQVEVYDAMTCGDQWMMLSDFVKYFESSPDERENLNVLSLEFSLTPLAEQVHAPALIREIDWVELYWPKELRNTPSTFPKVQNYCVMSAKGSFMDFHRELGGTSVWYHMHKGQQTFWVIEPTEENILKYEQWILEGTQFESFFGDLVDKCARIELYEGDTFIIPSGWIKAVYAPEDTLAFSGYFLHSFSIPMQIRTSRSENTLMIKKDYRYPKYAEMMLYVVQSIVKRATGRIYEIDRAEKPLILTYDEKDEKVDSDDEEIDVNNDGMNDEGEIMESSVKNGTRKETHEDVTTNEETVFTGIGASSAIPMALDKPVPNVGENSLTFNDEYLATISKKEREGFKVLLSFMRDSINNSLGSKSQNLQNLLDVFEQVLSHQLPKHPAIKEEKEYVEAKASMLNRWWMAFGKNESLATKRNVLPREKTTGTRQFSPHKPPKRRVKRRKKLVHRRFDGSVNADTGPAAVMPIPSQAAAPSGSERTYRRSDSDHRYRSNGNQHENGRDVPEEHPEQDEFVVEYIIGYLRFEGRLCEIIMEVTY